MKSTEEQTENIKKYFDFMLAHADKGYSMTTVVRGFKLPSSMSTFLVREGLITSRYFDGNKKAYTFSWDGSDTLITKCLNWIKEDCQIRCVKNNSLRRKKAVNGFNPDYRVDRFVMNMY